MHSCTIFSADTTVHWWLQRIFVAWLDVVHDDRPVRNCNLGRSIVRARRGLSWCRASGGSIWNKADIAAAADLMFAESRAANALRREKRKFGDAASDQPLVKQMLERTPPPDNLPTFRHSFRPRKQSRNDARSKATEDRIKRARDVSTSKQEWAKRCRDELYTNHPHYTPHRHIDGRHRRHPDSDCSARIQAWHARDRARRSLPSPDSQQHINVDPELQTHYASPAPTPNQPTHLSRAARILANALGHSNTIVRNHANPTHSTHPRNRSYPYISRATPIVSRQNIHSVTTSRLLPNGQLHRGSATRILSRPRGSS